MARLEDMNSAQTQQLIRAAEQHLVEAKKKELVAIRETMTEVIHKQGFKVSDVFPGAKNVRGTNKPKTPAKAKTAPAKKRTVKRKSAAKRNGKSHVAA